MWYLKHYIARLYVRVDVVLICGKHMLDCIISLQRNVLGHKIRLAPPLFIEVLEKVIVINLCTYKFSVGFWNCSECVILLRVVVSGVLCCFCFSWSCVLYAVSFPGLSISIALRYSLTFILVFHFITDKFVLLFYSIYFSFISRFYVCSNVQKFIKYIYSSL